MKTRDLQLKSRKGSRTSKPSVAERIVTRLQGFTEALKNKEVISEQFTCRTIKLDLARATYDAKMVRKARNVLETSQTVFARFLGVSVKTVRAWEQGVNTPNEIACRFMDEIRHDPEYWRKRLRAAIVVRPSTAKS